MKIYNNTQETFILLAYSPSHSRILFRSLKDRDRKYNIDIYFKSVKSINMPTRIKGIKISSDALGLSSHSKLIIHDIKGDTYEVVAGAVGIYHNDLDILESSIERYETENYKEECQLWYSE